MVSQIRIQLNLYSHRFDDMNIIEKLHLDSTENPNRKVKEILYSLSQNNTNQSDIQVDSDIMNSLKAEIEALKLENLKLQTENSTLKQAFSFQEPRSVEKKNEDKKSSDNGLNKKLLASAKMIEL